MPLIAELDQLAVVRPLDVVGAHPLEYVSEESELPIGVNSGRLRTRYGEDGSRLGCHDRKYGAGSRTDEK